MRHKKTGLAGRPEGVRIKNELFFRQIVEEDTPVFYPLKLYVMTKLKQIPGLYDRHTLRRI